MSHIEFPVSHNERVVLNEAQGMTATYRDRVDSEIYGSRLQAAFAEYMKDGWCADLINRIQGEMVGYLQHKKKSSEHLHIGHDELVEMADKHLERSSRLSNVQMVLCKE